MTSAAPLRTTRPRPDRSVLVGLLREQGLTGAAAARAISVGLQVSEARAYQLLSGGPVSDAAARALLPVLGKSGVAKLLSSQGRRENPKLSPEGKRRALIQASRVARASGKPALAMQITDLLDSLGK